jgi:CheY-like chemotaxis protein
MALTATNSYTFDALERLAERFAKRAAASGQDELSKVKVLIAEDDLMMADMIEDILIVHGYEVCGIASTVAEAIRLGSFHKPELAILDLRLANSGLGTEIASQLRSLGRLGVLYATGYASNVPLTAADGDACLSKPYRPDQLLHSLQLVADIVVSGKATPPFPTGFHTLRMPAQRGSSLPVSIAATTTSALASRSGENRPSQLPLRGRDGRIGGEPLPQPTIGFAC